MPPEDGVLGDLDELLSEVGTERGGALWSLAVRSRQLDANVIRLPAGARVAAHVEPDLDVLLCVVEGSGSLTTPAGEQRLTRGAVAWLAHGAERALAADGEGLVYLTVHRRRPGLSIGRASASEGGEAACLLHQVCRDCGRLATERTARYCVQCGARLTED